MTLNSVLFLFPSAWRLGLLFECHCVLKGELCCCSVLLQRICPVCVPWYFFSFDVDIKPSFYFWQTPFSKSTALTTLVTFYHAMSVFFSILQCTWADWTKQQFLIDSQSLLVVCNQIWLIEGVSECKWQRIGAGGLEHVGLINYLLLINVHTTGRCMFDKYRLFPYFCAF